ncbi:hypothetical protein ACX2VI_002206 [Cronobacter dublinensis]
MAHATPRVDEVKPAVIDFFKRSAGNPNDCALLKDANAKNPQDEQTRMLMVGFCDSDIDFTKPVMFSAMSSYESQGQRYICGVISGETSLGKKWVPGLFPLSPYIWWWATSSRPGPSSSALTMTFWSMNFARR